MEEIKYQGKFVKVTEEIIDGLIWERAYLPDGVMVFPLTPELEVYMIQEKRPHEKKPIRLKFVTGQLDKGEDPLLTANREMQEEIGIKASKLTVLLERHASGTVNNRFYQVIAQGLSESKIPNPDGEDTILSIEKYSIPQILSFLDEGKLDWSMGAMGIIKLDRLIKQGKIKAL